MVTPTPDMPGRPSVMTCIDCGATLSATRARLHLAGNLRDMAWDHVAESEGKCTAVNAMRDPDGAPLDSSARFAARISAQGDTRPLRVVETEGLTAYHLESVHHLLWASATIVAPAGYEPLVTLSQASPAMSTMKSTAPVGVGEHNGQPEFMFLRAGVGDWLVVSRQNPQMMRAIPPSDMGEVFAEIGVDETQWKEMAHVRDLR